MPNIWSDKNCDPSVQQEHVVQRSIIMVVAGKNEGVGGVSGGSGAGKSAQRKPLIAKKPSSATVTAAVEAGFFSSVVAKTAAQSPTKKEDKSPVQSPEPQPESKAEVEPETAPESSKPVESKSQPEAEPVPESKPAPAPSVYQLPMPDAWIDVNSKCKKHEDKKPAFKLPIDGACELRDCLCINNSNIGLLKGYRRVVLDGCPNVQNVEPLAGAALVSLMNCSNVSDASSLGRVRALTLTGTSVKDYSALDGVRRLFK